jgi:XTP/dITP diphosphohydrolase
MKIVFGSGNKHKVFEVNEIAKGSRIEFIPAPDGFAPIENGESFEENSFIKAKEASKMTLQTSLADDSGLCIDALNGAPGLFSARYAGSQQEKIERVLSELKGKTNRKAKFVCCMTLVDSKGQIIHTTRGECHGNIIEAPKGINGFGYDPIFMPDGFDITLAEMSEEGKNSISHRGKALTEMIKYLTQQL